MSGVCRLPLTPALSPRAVRGRDAASTISASAMGKAHNRYPRVPSPRERGEGQGEGQQPEMIQR